MVRTPRVPVWTPNAAHVLERDGPVVGQRGRGDWTANMHPNTGEQAAQACQRSPGYAHLPDPPVSTMGLQSVGVQSSVALNSEQALRHDIRRCLEGAFQGRRGSRIRYQDRGFSVQRHASTVSCLYLL